MSAHSFSLIIYYIYCHISKLNYHTPDLLYTIHPIIIHTIILCILFWIKDSHNAQNLHSKQKVCKHSNHVIIRKSCTGDLRSFTSKSWPWPGLGKYSTQLFVIQLRIHYIILLEYVSTQLIIINPVSPSLPMNIELAPSLYLSISHHHQLPFLFNHFFTTFSSSLFASNTISFIQPI